MNVDDFPEFVDEELCTCSKCNKVRQNIKRPPRFITLCYNIVSFALVFHNIALKLLIAVKIRKAMIQQTNEMMQNLGPFLLQLKKVQENT